MDAIFDILEEACDQARELRQRNPEGQLAFWRFLETYNRAALDGAHRADAEQGQLGKLDPAVVFSPLVLRQPRLRAFLAAYELHRHLYLKALGDARPTQAQETLRAADALIHRVFLGFPEPGYLSFPGLAGYLEDPEREWEDIRLQESFIARRLDLPPAEAAERLTMLERALAASLPRAAQKPRQPPPILGRDMDPDLDYSTPSSGGTEGPPPGPGPGPDSIPVEPVGPRSPTRGTPPEEKGGFGAPAGPLGPSGTAVNEGAEDPAPPPPDEDRSLYRVWYGTTRQPVSEASAQAGYGKDADSRQRIHRGYCDVLIPRTHAFGSVGSGWLKRWLRPWRQDDRLCIEQIARMDEAIFLSSIRRELGALDPEDRVALVYIHGFRTSFEEAAIRAAQIGFDLKVPGVTAFFSWHSRGEVDEYLTDREAIQEAEEPLRQFLLQFARDVDAEKVHLIAHSMGNQGLARVIQDIADEVTEESGKPFAQILLAAPDIGQTLFRRLARVYPKISERTTLYVSRKDKALWLSRWLQGTPRAGFTPPVTVVDDIDTVEVTDIDLTFLGHGYWAEAEPVLYDMKELIDDNKPPGRRARLRQVAGPPPHWVIAK